METKLKIVLDGPAEAGKTSVVMQSVFGVFNEKYEPTVGIESTGQEFDIEGQKIKVNFWDTSRSKEYSPPSLAHYSFSDAIVLVVDASLDSSVKELAGFIAGARESLPDKPIFILLNKSDLGVSKGIEEYLKEIKLKYFSICAKNETEVKIIIKEITSLIAKDL